MSIENMSELSFPEKIEKARREARLNQSDLADKTGLSLSTIQRIEKGTRDCDLEEIKKISQITGKPLAFFIDLPPQRIEIKNVKVPVVSMAKGDDMEGFEFEQLEHHEYEYIDFSGCKAVKISGNSMAPLAYNGQKVIYSEEDPVREGDLVFVRLKKGEQFFKRYHKDTKNGIITLLSINIANHGPINKKIDEIEFMYRVVGVKF